MLISDRRILVFFSMGPAAKHIYPRGVSLAILEFRGIHFRVTPGIVLGSGSYQDTSTRRKGGTHPYPSLILEGGYSESRGVCCMLLLSSLLFLLACAFALVW